jgi:DNA replication licensing factor MCM4
MIDYPSEVIPQFDQVTVMLHAELMELEEQDARIQVRVSQLRDETKIRNLGPNDIDRLIALRGMVIRVSDIIPEMRQATFKCV